MSVSYCSIVVTHYAFSFPRIQTVNSTGKKGFSLSFPPPHAADYHVSFQEAKLRKASWLTETNFKPPLKTGCLILLLLYRGKESWQAPEEPLMCYKKTFNLETFLLGRVSLFLIFISKWKPCNNDYISLPPTIRQQFLLLPPLLNLLSPLLEIPTCLP